MGVYVVTGGTGFIGSRLVKKLLDEGHVVHVVSRRSLAPQELQGYENVHFHAVDISIANTHVSEQQAPQMGSEAASINTIQALVEKLHTIENPIHGCFHLAAIADVADCQKDPVTTSAINVVGSQNVFSAFDREGIPVIAASSARVSDSNPGIYAGQKAAMEKAAKRCRQVTCIRLPNVFGGGKGVIDTWINNLIMNENLNPEHQKKPADIMKITPGSEQVERDFIHIDRVVDMFIRVMNDPRQHKRKNIFGYRISLAQLKEQILELYSPMDDRDISSTFAKASKKTFRERQEFIACLQKTTHMSRERAAKERQAVTSQATPPTPEG